VAELLTCYRHPDRETGVSCSECGRGICPDCMTFGPVGIRCPEHSGQPQGVQKVVKNVQRRSSAGARPVTKAIVAINVGIFLLQLAMGAPMSTDAGRIWQEGVLYGPAVANGDWYRLLSAAFLHYGPIHLAMNMLAVWWLGGLLEDAIGSLRYGLLYVVSGLAGSAGALLFSPNGFTVGASGAVFGILGAALVLERQRTMVFGGAAITLLVLNLAFTFAIPGISIGGHLGGLAGGALAMLAMTRFGRVSAVYGRTDLASMAGIVAVGLLSVFVAYLSVNGYV
jgi:membrane associated rhomboid family serine protease